MGIQTVAGTLAGYSKHHIVRFNEDTGEVKPIRLKGRWLYVRKCERSSLLQGIAIPDCSRDNTNCAVVLGIGEQSGTRERLSKTDREKWRKCRDWVPCVNVDDIEPGVTRVMCPDDHDWGIHRVDAYDKDEYRVYDCIPFAILNEE
jgi:hypothetical protein